MGTDHPVPILFEESSLFISSHLLASADLMLEEMPYEGANRIGITQMFLLSFEMGMPVDARNKNVGE